MTGSSYQPINFWSSIFIQATGLLVDRPFYTYPPCVTSIGFWTHAFQTGPRFFCSMVLSQECFSLQILLGWCFIDNCLVALMFQVSVHGRKLTCALSLPDSSQQGIQEYHLLGCQGQSPQLVHLLEIQLIHHLEPPFSYLQPTPTPSFPTPTSHPLAIKCTNTFFVIHLLCLCQDQCQEVPCFHLSLPKEIQAHFGDTACPVPDHHKTNMVVK